MRPRSFRRGSLLLAVLLAAAGCSSGAGPDAGDAGGPRVVATTTIYGDLVASVLGDAGTVEVLMQPGQDPHGFSPSARQAQSLREADLVVANGLDLEEGLVDALGAAEADGVQVLYIAEEVDPIAYGEDEAEHAEHADDEDHEEHGDLDPHVWLDPVRMAEAAEIVAARLAELAGDGGTDWVARGTAVADGIRTAADEAGRILEEVPAACRVLVTNHEALGYFAERYDFEVVGAIIPGASSQAQPSAQDFAALAELLRDAAVPAIFAETSQSTRLADSLAAEVGRDIVVVELYTESLGEAGTGAEDYAGLVTTNARLVADALRDC